MDATHIETARYWRGKFDETVEGIRRDRALSDEGRRVRMAQAYLEAADKIDAARTKHEAAVADRRRKLEASLFGSQGSADPSSAISYRDALDRVDALPRGEQGERQSSKLFDRAVMTGDEQLQRALLFRGWREGWDDVVNGYIAQRPGAQDSLRELGGLIEAADSREGRLGITAAFRVPKPTELGSRSRSQIEALAEDDARSPKSGPRYVAI
ncbi:hypothetical protein CLV56_2825 [Mumia flava]|uniref:Uncharacterized protein n=1 Tax=Mumia flava TaxID=1348852 RepID=A0A0B2BV97_9ACTN|nr:hypothetical protein [Mumia flava]PJJ58574.1 hypothetical protein CLV56_2825 [Mumia flava]